MKPSQDPPLLLQFIFGPAASTAWAAASPRLRIWAAAFDDWLAHRKLACHPSTFYGSRAAWKRLLADLAKAPWEIEPADLQSFMERMRSRGYAASTLSTDMGNISAFYRWSAAHAVDPACGPHFNPAAAVKSPRKRVIKNFLTLTRQQAAALLDALRLRASPNGLRDYAFFLTRLRFGVALADIRKLRWRQIQAAPGGATVRFRPHAAPVPLPDEVWRAIRDYLAAAGRLETIPPDAYIFTPLAGPPARLTGDRAAHWAGDHPLFTSNLTRILKIVGRKAKIPAKKLTLDVLRHTAAKFYFQFGGELEDFRDFMGHKSYAVNRQYFRRMSISPSPPLAPGQDGAAVPLPYDLSGGVSNRSLPLDPDAGRPPDEVAAIAAQDIRGLDWEIAALRWLRRRLQETPPRARSASLTARITETISRASACVGRMLNAKEKAAHRGPRGAQGEGLLQVLDAVALESSGPDETPPAVLPSVAIRREALAGYAAMHIDSPDLTEEIASVRLALRDTYALAISDPSLPELVTLTHAFIKSCGSLLKLLDSNTPAGDRLEEYLNTCLNQALVEFTGELMETYR